MSESVRFVQRVLELTGTKHVWLGDDLVRVEAHPQLCELTGELPFVDLALSDDAFRSYPSAQLCTPGSYALERLLAWVRGRPRVFSSQLTLSPELPQDALGTLPAANARPVLLASRPAERRLLRVLARLALRADELLERVVECVVDETGSVHSRLVGKLDELPRQTGRASAAIPAPLLDCLQREGERLAAEAAEELQSRLAERLQAEEQRLEAFLRSQRDDLPSQLPNSSARRAAGIEAEARAVLDDLGRLLPGEGPWERDALLELLEPPFWAALFGRRRVELPLAEERRPGVTELIRRLPERFHLTDARALVEQETAARVARFRKTDEAGRGAVEILREWETRLEAEHQVRLAEARERFRLRVTVQPILLEWISHATTVCWVQLHGRATLPLEAVWDPVSAGWTLPPCGCGHQEVQQLWLCELGHAACERCASVCAGCETARCGACAHALCGACSTPACESCGGCCDTCGEWHCPRHRSVCPECARAVCGQCAGACGACGTPVCPEHGAGYDHCEQRLCGAHEARCVTCDRPGCTEHSPECPACGAPHCPAHTAQCGVCGQHACLPCAGDGRRCSVCRELTEAGPATVEALRSLLSRRAPALGGARFSRLWHAQNGRFQVVVGRRWATTYVVVIPSGEGEASSITRRWSIAPFRTR